MCSSCTISRGKRLGCSLMGETMERLDMILLFSWVGWESDEGDEGEITIWKMEDCRSKGFRVYETSENCCDIFRLSQEQGDTLSSLELRARSELMLLTWDGSGGLRLFSPLLGFTLKFLSNMHSSDLRSHIIWLTFPRRRGTHCSGLLVHTMISSHFLKNLRRLRALASLISTRNWTSSLAGRNLRYSSMRVMKAAFSIWYFSAARWHSRKKGSSWELAQTNSFLGKALLQLQTILLMLLTWIPGTLDEGATDLWGLGLDRKMSSPQFITGS